MSRSYQYQLLLTQSLSFLSADAIAQLLGALFDVPNDAVSDENVRKFMEKHSVKLFREVSAKTGNQVQDAFKALG